MIHSFDVALSDGGCVSGQVKYRYRFFNPRIISIKGQYRANSCQAENGAWRLSARKITPRTINIKPAVKAPL